MSQQNPTYRLFIPLLLVLLLGSGLRLATAQEAQPTDACEIETEGEQDGYSNQVVIKLRDSADLATLHAITTTHNVTVANTLLASRGIYLLTLPQIEDADNVDDDIFDDFEDALLYAEPNYIGNIPEADPSGAWIWGSGDPAQASEQYAHDLINLSPAHSVTLGAGVTIAVLDTGIQSDHPYFDGRIVAGYDFVADDTNPADLPDGSDSNANGLFDEAVGHGTHVAGIVHLVAPDANIMPLRVLNGDGAGNLFVVAEAILYAAEQGADVISLSLGSTQPSAVLEEAVAAAQELGVIIVAAAGNNHSTQAQFPAAFEDVLAVTSIGADSTKAETANYGCWVDVAAPGESIFSAMPTDKYAWWSGTSMATPFVASQAALLLANTPARAAEDVPARIRASAVPIDAQNPTYATLLGAGRIDVGAAVQGSGVPTVVSVTAVDVGSQSVLPMILLAAPSLVLGTLYIASGGKTVDRK